MYPHYVFMWKKPSDCWRVCILLPSLCQNIWLYQYIPTLLLNVSVMGFYKKENSKLGTFLVPWMGRCVHLQTDQRCKKILVSRVRPLSAGCSKIHWKHAEMKSLCIINWVCGDSREYQKHRGSIKWLFKHANCFPWMIINLITIFFDFFIT